ncbi:hypothetical protein [Streptacidiphilus anmyonensis]|uniref:hypothetical protein n=1 Tax=Streptacidiphilus anmyonensis TaxID=405782 RepID=UPI0005AADCED|nr:hypothetical protein [Streptacidiphilus anmyonensis]
MVQVFDAVQGRLIALPPAGRRALRLRVHLECPGLVAGWDEARALVVADVLFRALEMEGVQVFPAIEAPDLPPLEAKRLDRLLASYNLRAPDADDDLYADVHVLTSGGGDPRGPGVVLRVGPTSASAPIPPLPADPTDHDAAVRRCALLATPCREPLSVSAAVLADAANTLAGWRAYVAYWSQAPSAPVPPAVRDRARGLLDADLDTPGLLGLLGEVADDPGQPDGARFEAFVWLDRVLGIELGRDVGHA